MAPGSQYLPHHEAETCADRRPIGWLCSRGLGCALQHGSETWWQIDQTCCSLLLLTSAMEVGPDIKRSSGQFFKSNGVCFATASSQGSVTYLRERDAVVHDGRLFAEGFCKGPEGSRQKFPHKPMSMSECSGVSVRHPMSSWPWLNAPCYFSAAGRKDLSRCLKHLRNSTPGYAWVILGPWWSLFPMRNAPITVHHPSHGLRNWGHCQAPSTWSACEPWSLGPWLCHIMSLMRYWWIQTALKLIGWTT